MEGVCAPVLDRIVKRPELVRELGRQERMTAFRQLLFVAGPILAALAELSEEGGGREKEGPGTDDLWTVKELAAKLRINPRTVYAGIKSGKYPFAIADGRNIRISRLGFQKWQARHMKTPKAA